MADEVEEAIPLRDRVLDIVRPRDAEALLDEKAFEHEEFLPYWAELWPSGVALARRVSARALKGARTLELGCGLGIPSVAAALAGGRVLATDWSAESIAFTRRNAERNGARLETAICAWDDAERILAPAPWDLVLAADVLYERRNADQLLELLPRLVGPGSEVWLADPDRPPAAAFLEAAAGAFIVTTARDSQRPAVAHHTLRRR